MDEVRNGKRAEGSSTDAVDDTVSGIGQNPSPVYHGGSLTQARTEFPSAPEPWIDLSTGINPIAYPVPDITPAAWRRLPDPSDVAALEARAARAFGMDDPALVVATPGTQALIQMLPRLTNGQTVGIYGFTYQEHARVWRDAGREVTIVDRFDDLSAFDVALLVNPNNPDGRFVPPSEIVALALDAVGSGRQLIIDEAFVDVLPPDASVASRLPLPGVVVLRSFGKTWGLAGVRLGFALTARDVADRIRTEFGPWALSGPALEIGSAALADADWLTATRRRLAIDSDRLDGLISAAGLRVVGGTPLFRLARGENAPTVFGRLGGAGIWVRRFPSDRTLLRFGIPEDEGAWERLSTALSMSTIRS